MCKTGFEKILVLEGDFAFRKLAPNEEWDNATLAQFEIALHQDPIIQQVMLGWNVPFTRDNERSCGCALARQKLWCVVGDQCHVFASHAYILHKRAFEIFVSKLGYIYRRHASYCSPNFGCAFIGVSKAPHRDPGV